jgi:hypothetical protein
VRTTDEIVADVCAALSVESVEIRRPERTIECAECGTPFESGRCPVACASCGGHEVVPECACSSRPTQQIVQTAGFDYYGNDRLDVSHGSPDPTGGWFAPSRSTHETLRCAVNSGVSALVERAIDQFSWEYLGEMRASFGIVPGSEYWCTLAPDEATSVRYALDRGVEPNPDAWSALLAKREVTLVCRCGDAQRCHRVLLARILVKLGARYVGEVR